MSLRTRITEDMKTAMRAKDAPRLGAIRLLQAAIKQREVDERVELDDVQVVAVIDKMLKQRRDSIAQYEAAGRTDLSDAEKHEVSVLQAYMPEALSEAELERLVAEAVANTGAVGVKDMGKVMAQVRPQAAGRADMGLVSALIKARLGG